ncbi:MAG: hypothetical protein LBD31_07560 [Treponema sp.]|nr:hypothetical protein [Treponema sp.]
MSCSSIQAGLYLASVDKDNGPAILNNEVEVRRLLEDMLASWEQYSMKAFVRTGISFQFKRTKLLTHSYYVIVSNNNGKFHTLSFYGTKMSFYSEGAWALDADSDMTSYTMYLEGNNQWDVMELFPDMIDTKKTLRNILDKMQSGVTYYYKDHIINKPNMDNCNTALYETIKD